MKFTDYLQRPGINWSRLKHARESMARYRYECDHARKDSATLAIGRAVHTIVFEPHQFHDSYAIWHKDRKGIEWAAFEAAHAGLTILKTAEFEHARAMAEAVKASPLAQPYLRDDAVFEVTVEWEDPITGLACKARPDILRPLVLADLKTAASIDARRFGYQAHRLGYACQLAHYAAGIKATYGWLPQKVALIVVEKVPPYEVAVFEVGEEDLQRGAEEVAALLQSVAACEESGVWPGRYAEAVPLSMPSFVDGELEIDYVE